MNEKLTISIPSQGSLQILSERQKLLSQFDIARIHSSGHSVETHHGNVAESAYRNWLSEFLPKRYGVTAGYIISTGIGKQTPLQHFDVIIYDQLESPTLWVEGTADHTQSGRARGIPVEHVRGVLEIKSTFSSQSAKKAIEQLSKLAPMLQGIDAPQERYKLHLPASFFSGVVFFELKENDAKSITPLQNLCQGIGLRGFMGGSVLRGETNTNQSSAQIFCVIHNEKSEAVSFGDRPLLNNFAISQTQTTSENSELGLLLLWSETSFTQFAFDILARLNGTYDPRRISSFHGLI